MPFFIEPLDVLFFRDSKPFSAGDVHGAKGDTLLPAQAFAGAVRSAVLARVLSKAQKTFGDFATDPKVQALAAEVGTPGGYGDFCCLGPFPAQERRGEWHVWLPTPFDLLKETDKKDSRVVRELLPMEKTADVIACRPPATAPLWLAQERASGECQSPLFTDHQLAVYLKHTGGRPAIQLDEQAGSEFFRSERRVGIALEQDRRAREGLLYSAHFMRVREDSFTRKGFIIETNATSLGKEGLLKLGGEGRAATYSQLPEESLKAWYSLIKGSDSQELRKQLAKSRRFKLYLAAPALFSQGWLPDFIQPDTLCSGSEGLLGKAGIKVRLVSAAVGKPLHIGGWDMAKHMPKVMYKAVPGGSVYFMECLEGDTDSLFSLLHGTVALQQQVADAELREFASIGYGLTFIGGWQPAGEVK